jgi:hypothetical protein
MTQEEVQKNSQINVLNEIQEIKALAKPYMRGPGSEGEW